METACEEPACHSRRWISAVSLHSAEGQPSLSQEKGVFWVEPQKEACQMIITARDSSTNNTPEGRASPPSLSFTCLCLDVRFDAKTCISEYIHLPRKLTIEVHDE